MKGGGESRRGGEGRDGGGEEKGEEEEGEEGGKEKKEEEKGKEEMGEGGREEDHLYLKRPRNYKASTLYLLSPPYLPGRNFVCIKMASSKRTYELKTNVV